MRMIPHEESLLPGFTSFRSQMNRLFDEFFNEGEMPRTSQQWWPPVDVIETPKKIEVVAELPGVDAKDIQISVVGDTLTIEGEKTRSVDEKDKTWHRREVHLGKFVRSIPLPTAIKSDQIEAIDTAGVLRITLPKREEARARKIPVKVK